MEKWMVLISLSGLPIMDGKNTVSNWDSKVGYLASTDPVVITEFGDTSGNCTTLSTFDQNLINWAEPKGISWTAWAWYPKDCTFPSLITDCNRTANAGGTVIRQGLQKNP